MPTFFKWEQPSRVDTAKAKKREAETLQREVYRAVDARDKGRCRACGKACSAYAVTMLEKAHHHHIVYRSAQGEQASSNVVTLCAQDHDAIHVKRTLAIDGNADIALTFSKRGEDGQWFVWRQEKEVGVYERD